MDDLYKLDLYTKITGINRLLIEQSGFLTVLLSFCLLDQTFISWVLKVVYNGWSRTQEATWSGCRCGWELLVGRRQSIPHTILLLYSPQMCSRLYCPPLYKRQPWIGIYLTKHVKLTHGKAVFKCGFCQSAILISRPEFKCQFSYFHWLCHDEQVNKPLSSLFPHL